MGPKVVSQLLAGLLSEPGGSPTPPRVQVLRDLPAGTPHPVPPFATPRDSAPSEGRGDAEFKGDAEGGDKKVTSVGPSFQASLHGGCPETRHPPIGGCKQLDILDAPLSNQLIRVYGSVFEVGTMKLDMSSFGGLIASARRREALSQKELAAKILKEDGEAITPQYLNDIEHDRRSPSSDYLVRQFAKALKISVEALSAAAGVLAEEDRRLVRKATTDRVESAYVAFRKELRK
jgi:transcriptional regulator with XRE-family HTH domain